MNLRKLSEMTGFSVSTISKAFSGSREIPPSTRDKIFEAAKNAGVYEKYYRPVPEKPVVAVIAPEFISEFYSQMLAIMDGIARENGIILTVSQTNFDNSRTGELVRYYSHFGGADGIILIAAHGDDLRSTAVPIVAIGDSGETAELDRVVVDESDAIARQFEALRELGHKDIAFIGEKLTRTRMDRLRLEAERLGFNAPPEWLFVSGSRFTEAGREGAEALLSSRPLPTAVICAYDYIAIGAIKTFSNHGLSVPHDISVIGADNISLSSYQGTELATIDRHSGEVCSIAFDLLLKKIKNKYFRVRQTITVRAEFLMRASLGKVK